MDANWKRFYFMFLFCLCTFNLVSARWFSSEENHDDNSKYKVDYFVLAMEWPQGTCEYINATHRHQCVVSDQVKGWVLHGLWPSSFQHKFLQYCNKTTKFDFHKIEDLKADLLRYWPNLFKDSSRNYLWKHEYEKHGTCAALVKGFKTEKDYFSKAMGLLEKFDPQKVLEHGKIIPRGDEYDSEDIIHAFKSGYGDGVCTQCSRYDGGDTQVLSGVEVCLTKDLELMECPHCGRKYDCDGSVYFHPLHFGRL